MRRSNKGFTIVEVMMVLAISGAMFVIAFFGMRGQRESVGFRQALDGVEQKIREIFNNVDNGYFGNVGQYTCKLVSGNPVLEESQDGSSGGNNTDCVFIGKSISFNDNQMTINTIIGSRTDNAVTSEPEQLKETYAINNGVTFSPNSNLKVAALRDNDDDSTATNLRALRKFKINDNEWESLTDSNQPVFCFVLGDKVGSVTVLQKDIKVDYTGEGCAP